MNYDEWFFEVFCIEFVFEEVALDIITQLIIYDILHENVSKDIQELNYNKINNYLEKWIDKIEKIYEKYCDDLSKENIMKDDLEKRFFSFLNFNIINKKRKHLIDIYKKVNEMGITTSEEFIDKKVNFYEQLKNLVVETGGRDAEFLIYDFKDLDIVNKSIEESKNGKISYDEILRILDKMGNEEILNKEETNLEKKRDKKTGEILDWLKLNNTGREYSLDMKEAIFQIIENDKQVLPNFRKQLGNLINDKDEMYNFEIIETYLRVKTTYMIYKQKGILENFERNYLIQEKINKILEIINRIKNDKIRLEYKKNFFDNMLAMILFLNSDKYVVNITEENISNLFSEEKENLLYSEFKKRFLMRAKLFAPNLFDNFIKEEKKKKKEEKKKKATMIIEIINEDIII